MHPRSLNCHTSIKPGYASSFELLIRLTLLFGSLLELCPCLIIAVGTESISLRPRSQKLPLLVNLQGPGRKRWRSYFWYNKSASWAMSLQCIQK